MSKAMLSEISLRCLRSAEVFDILVEEESVDNVLFGALLLVLNFSQIYRAERFCLSKTFLEFCDLKVP